MTHTCMTKQNLLEVRLKIFLGVLCLLTSVDRDKRLWGRGYKRPWSHCRKIA